MNRPSNFSSRPAFPRPAFKRPPRGRAGGRPLPKRQHQINEEIHAREVRTVDEEGKALGVLSIKDALTEARERGVDLVAVVPEANPPVCKLVEYGKFVYQLDKKKKEIKKHSKTTQLKEIKMRPKTDIHDYNFKIKHVKEFLAKGDKVKVTIQFKGREMAFINLGRERMERIITDTKDVAKVEIPSKLEGRHIHVTLSPLKKAVPKTDKADTMEKVEKTEKIEINDGGEKSQNPPTE